MDMHYPDICSIVNCNEIERCAECPLYYSSSWDDEYKEENIMVQVDKELQAKVVRAYGDEIQSTICMEECAELIQAISKMKRGKDYRDNLSEEIADVFIAINQLRVIYGITDDEINNWILKKQIRQENLLEERKEK